MGKRIFTLILFGLCVFFSVQQVHATPKRSCGNYECNGCPIESDCGFDSKQCCCNNGCNACYPNACAPQPTNTTAPLPPTKTPTPVKTSTPAPTALPTAPPVPTSSALGTTCDQCGLCQNEATPGNWGACRKCLYPTFGANTFIATPDPNYAFTVFGCIQANSGGFSSFFVNFFSTVIGGIGFLGILFGGIKVMLARGDAQELSEGRRYIYGSLVALLVVLFSVFLVKMVGGSILKIPFLQ